MGLYENVCGEFKIEVSKPYPAWVSIKRGNVELRNMTVKDIRDLRYLLENAENAIARAGAE